MLDIDRIVKHAQPGAVTLSHLSFPGVDLWAELPQRLEVVRRHFGPVLGDADYQARKIMKLPVLRRPFRCQKKVSARFAESTVTRSASDLIDDTSSPDSTNADAISNSQTR